MNPECSGFFYTAFMSFLRYIIGFVFSFFLMQDALYAQDSTTVKWETASRKTGDKQYELIFNGKIKTNWHLYAKASQADEIAGILISLNDSSIRQTQPQITTNYRNIDDQVFGKKMDVGFDSIRLILPITFSNEVVSPVRVNVSYYTGYKDNFIPEEQKFYVELEGAAVKKTANRILIPSIDINNPVDKSGVVSETKSQSLFAIFGLGFIGGLLALFLPCFFPMIPLTVSFFTKRAVSKKTGIRNAFLYGFFIFAIYVLITIPFHFAEQLKPEIFNNISTNIYLNIFFFLVFVLFAISFFGYYELTLPSSISGKVDSRAGVGNIAGIFFMALTLALVSFSCTGPVLGSLLAGTLAGDGGATRLTVGMSGFGLALALPFALFALFPNWLNSLPKSGGWLNTVKVVLGFLELAFAFKFLSNADLVMHWGLLKREVFIGIWIVIGVCLSLYLFGKIRFPHDSPIKKLSIGRMTLGLVTVLFTLYLIPGLTNTKWANLKLISGFPPPLYYSVYPQTSDCILSLNCTRSYEEGLKMAKAENKPLLLDFTGYACVNCRRMEENVWSDAEVNSLMKENFIVVSLYVDDKMKLPAAEQQTYQSKDGSTKEIITVGDQWSTFETENFANNAQPLYAILNTEEKLLSYPVAYTPSVKEYLQWLKKGLETFKTK